METFGDRIRRLREGASITQQALADILELTSGAVSQWEHGRALPKLQLIVPLAEALHVGVEDLLFNVRW